MTAPSISKAGAIALIAELFREYGYHGTSYSQITKATGLGKGSLYHYFPKGKQDVAQAVLENIHHWFEEKVFRPLEEDAVHGADIMFQHIEEYFHSGRRICLLGAFALYDVRSVFEKEISGYFARWAETLQHYLIANGLADEQAGKMAINLLAQIQGGLVMAHALNNAALFTQTLEHCAKQIRDRRKNLPDSL